MIWFIISALLGALATEWALERRGETDEYQWKMDVDGLVLEARRKEKRQAQEGMGRRKYSTCPYKLSTSSVRLRLTPSPQGEGLYRRNEHEQL